jgi:DNA-binding NarL/FixJ family response regulator
VTTQIRVLLADDHPLVRAGLRASLQHSEGITLVGEATNGVEVLPFCTDLTPDVVLLDLHMSGPPPQETVALLRARLPQIKLIILTAYDDEAYVRSMLAAGVHGYVLKEEAIETVERAIRAVLEGDRWLSAAIVTRLAGGMVEDLPVTKILATLTERERQMLQLLVRGWDNARIAQELALAEQTVRNYLSRIYTTIGVRSRAEAIVWARDISNLDFA